MKVLIAEDEPVSRRLLSAALERAGYEVVTAGDGGEAWAMLQCQGDLRLAVLDWMMPEVDGVDVCRRVRAMRRASYTYLILLTSLESRDDVVRGFESGADDYMTKPFDAQELLCRVRVGERVVRLEADLARKIDELQDALAHVRQLQGLLPICQHCKKIRDDGNCWQRLENYIEEHSEALFSHGICEECLLLHYPDFAADTHA